MDKNIDNYNGCNIEKHIQDDKMHNVNSNSPIISRLVYIRDGFYFFCRWVRTGVLKCWYKYFPKVKSCFKCNKKTRNQQVEDITRDIINICTRSLPPQRSPQRTKVNPMRSTSSGIEMSRIGDIPVVETSTLDIVVEQPKDEETGDAKEVISNPVLKKKEVKSEPEVTVEVETDGNSLKPTPEATVTFDESLFPEITDKYNNEQMIQNIEVIGQIKPKDKLYYHDKVLTINISYGLTRWWNSQNRYLTVSVLDHIFKEFATMKPDLDDETLDKINNEKVLSCITGVTNLKQTYVDNPDVNAKLTQVLLYIHEECLN